MEALIPMDTAPVPSAPAQPFSLPPLEQIPPSEQDGVRHDTQPDMLTPVASGPQKPDDLEWLGTCISCGCVDCHCTTGDENIYKPLDPSCH